MNKKFSTVLFAVAALCAVTISSSVILYNNIGKNTFNGDETNWISTGYYYTNLLLKCDFDLNKWHGKQFGDFGGRMYLHLGQWIIGIPLTWYSRRHGREFCSFYNFSRTFEENQRAGRVPPRDILLYARGTTAFVGVLCCIAMMAIGWYAKHAWVGCGAAVLLMKNRIFIKYGARAMLDIHYAFFLLCSLLLITILVKQKKSILLVSILCGIAAGLTASVKLIGMGVIGLMLLAYLIYQHSIQSVGIKKILLYIGLFSFSAVAVIYLLDPYLWDVTRPLKFLSLVRAWIGINYWLGRDYAALWENNRTWVFHRDFSNRMNFSAEWVLLCIGIAVNSIFLVSSLRKKKVDVRLMPFFFFIVNYAFLLAFTPVNWDRYFLPAIITSKLIVAGVLYDAGDFLYRRLWR